MRSMDKILTSNIPYKGPKSENLIEFIRDGLRANVDKPIIIDSQTGESWTGSDIEARIAVIAKFLIEDCGLQKGDVCSLYGPESDHIAILILAIISVGGISNFLTDKSSGHEIKDSASIMKSKFLFSYKYLLQKILPALTDTEAELQAIAFDEPCDGFKNGCKTMNGLYAKSDTTTGIPLDNLVRDVKIYPEYDYAIIQFSSGTTGSPKPIPRTHKNLCHLVASVDHEELMDLKPGVVLSGSLPITHRPGIWALLACVNCGSAFVIWSNLSDVDEALSVIEKYKVTIFSSSLPFLSRLGNVGLQLKDKYDTTSLQHIITSGAKIVNADLPKALIEEFNLKSLRQCFGMTEAGWVFLIEQSLAKDSYLSVGHVVPGMEVIILARGGEHKHLEAHERGEVALRGPQVFPGYLTGRSSYINPISEYRPGLIPHQPIKGPMLLNRSDFTNDGDWFLTGDQGFYDKDELVFIEGRYKEVMMFENNALYFPTEIEAIIAEHPAVEGVCVVKACTVTKDYSYDIARAFVTLKNGFDTNDLEILRFVNERAPQVIIGGGVRFLNKFPRLQNGKVDKQALKTMK